MLDPKTISTASHRAVSRILPRDVCHGDVLLRLFGCGCPEQGVFSKTHPPPKKMITHNSQIVARAGFKAADLFNQVEPPKTLPTDIQFMPPGRQEICPFVEGEPLQITIEVNPELANKLNEQLQSMRWKASQGQGDVPFIDFNHDDAEASGEVLELFWGGKLQ
jgi:hypothetical protein